MTKNQSLLLGAHVSIAGGFNKAIQQGTNIKATCIQIFTKSNRQWSAKKITPQEIVAFLDAQKKSNIKTVVAHASYLINLGSTSPLTEKKSINALAEELQRCELLHIKYLVLHPGTADKNNIQHSYAKIAKNLDAAIIASDTKKVMIILETMAGQGNTIGSNLDELAAIIKHIKEKKRIGVCVDTCHIFAAGYDISSNTSYKNFWLLFKKKIGMRRLKVMHVNDSKKEFASRVDRHEHIGKGKINIKAFKLIMNDKALKNIAKIIETPEEDNKELYDKKNIETLKSLQK